MGLSFTLLYIVTYYLSPPEMFPELAPYRVQLIVSALALMATLILLPIRGYPVRAPQNLLIFGLLATVVVSRLSLLWVGGALNAIMEFGSVLIVFFLLLANLDSLKRIKVVSLAFIGVAIYYAIMGIMGMNGVGSTKYVLTVDTLSRLRGLGNLNDPNDMAQVFLVAVALLGAFWLPRTPTRNLLMLAPAMLVLIYAMSLTKSRGAMLALALVMMVWLSRKLNVVLSALMAGGGLTVLMAIDFVGGRSMERDDGRLMAWSAAISMFKSHPLLGVGWGLFNDHHDLTTHNSYLLCLAELGTVGFFFWMSLVVISMLHISQIISKCRDIPELAAELRWAVAIRLALVAFLATSWFLSRTYSMTFYILVALVAVLSLHIQRRRPQIGLEWPRFRRLAGMTLAGQVAAIGLAYVMIQARLL